MYQSEYIFSQLHRFPLYCTAIVSVYLAIRPRKVHFSAAVHPFCEATESWCESQKWISSKGTSSRTVPSPVWSLQFNRCFCYHQKNTERIMTFLIFFIISCSFCSERKKNRRRQNGSGLMTVAYSPVAPVRRKGSDSLRDFLRTIFHTFPSPDHQHSFCDPRA